ncbi:MAG: hypothetical protein WCK98_03280 [bacterium]
MVRKSVIQLEQNLSDRLSLMKQAAYRFDEGNLLEYLHLALSVRLLLHDTNNSKSLLGLLNKKGDMINSGRVLSNNDNVIHSPNSSLTFNLIGNSLHYYSPNFDITGNPNLLNFHSWWEDEIIKDFDNEVFSRKYIILTIANKDNGAHVDDEIPEKYYKLNEKNSMQMFIGPILISSDGKPEFPKTLNISDLTPVPSPTPYVVRQIVHEILRQFSSDYNPLIDYYAGIQFADVALQTTGTK